MKTEKSLHLIKQKNGDKQLIIIFKKNMLQEPGIALKINQKLR